jgi:hypothetical protein
MERSPTVTPPTDLIRPGESPEAALRRIERHPEYVRIMESDAGQALLRECRRRAQIARRETVFA